MYPVVNGIIVNATKEKPNSILQSFVNKTKSVADRVLDKNWSGDLNNKNNYSTSIYINENDIEK
jgi:hypothetical protein